MFETLERRALLSATLNGGLLIIEGSAGDDHVQLVHRDGQFVVIENGVESAYASEAVARVEVNGGAGDDVIDAGEAGGARAAMLLNGGDGRDTILAAPGRTHARGGAGRDTLTGAGGRDYLDGGAGRDVLTAGADGSWLIGGRGADILTGGAGHDTIYAGRGEGARRTDGALDYANGNGGDDRYVYDGPGDAHAAVEQVEYFLIKGNPPTRVLFRGSSDDGVVAVVSAEFGSLSWFLRFGEPTLDGNKIRLEMLAYRPTGIAAAAMTTVRGKVNLGKLAAGSYDLEITGHDGQVLLSQSFYANRSGVSDSDVVWFRR